MVEKRDYDNEVFIDADAGFANEKNSYDLIIVQQIQACVKILSREMTGGQIIHKSSDTGTEKYIEDVRELVINHVDALRMLLSGNIQKENLKALNSIMKDIESYKKELGERKIIIAGQGIKKFKDYKSLNVDSPIWKEFIHYKALKYRELFEVLVNAYNDERAYIKSLEEE